MLHHFPLLSPSFTSFPTFDFLASLYFLMICFKKFLAFIYVGVSCCNHFTLLGYWSIVILHQITWTSSYVCILLKFSFFVTLHTIFLLQACIVLVKLYLLHHFAPNLLHNVLMYIKFKFVTLCWSSLFYFHPAPPFPPSFFFWVCTCMFVYDNCLFC